MQKVMTIFILGLTLIGLTGCTTTAESQMKESVCKNCFDEEIFYLNGLWLEEGSRG